MPKTYKIKTYNAIAQVGLDRFSDKYHVSADQKKPDAIMLRSQKLHEEPIEDTVLAIGRAGAGVNNVPLKQCSERGIVVFNAPGANANSVKELTIAGLLLASRNIDGALQYVRDLEHGETMGKQVEAGKKQYKGVELQGKTLVVIGLGAIGYQVANAAVALGMTVYGEDPHLNVDNAWRLSPAVHQVNDVDKVLSEADFVTVHVPLMDATKGMFNKEKISRLKNSATVLNFSRDEIVDEPAIIQALAAGTLKNYVTDFPNDITKDQKGVISLPHLGASTDAAEDNCAIMVADQLVDFLENGNITNSVNFPNTQLSRKGKTRVTIAHYNVPTILASILKILADAGHNIEETLNKSRADLAYTVVDLADKALEDGTTAKISTLKDVLAVRIIR